VKRKPASIKALAAGLDALRLLARIAPLTLADFAAAAALSARDARALIGVFQETGYAERIPGTALLRITPLARTLLSGRGRPPPYTSLAPGSYLQTGMRASLFAVLH
jgi:hypothetical protein